MFKAAKNIGHIGLLASLFFVAAALFLQMGQVQLTYKSCFKSGKEQVYFGGKDQCCSKAAQRAEPKCCSISAAQSDLEVPTAKVEAQCCVLDQTDAVFLSFIPKEQVQTWLKCVACFVPKAMIAKAPEAPLQSLEKWLHQKIPPVAGTLLLVHFCRFLI